LHIFALNTHTLLPYSSVVFAQPLNSLSPRPSGIAKIATDFAKTVRSNGKKQLQTAPVYPTPADAKRMSRFILDLEFVHATEPCDPRISGARCNMVCARRGDHLYDLPTLAALHRMRIDPVNIPDGPDVSEATQALYTRANLHLVTIVRCAGIEHNHALSAAAFRTTICFYMRLCPHPVDPGRPVQGSIRYMLTHTNCPNGNNESRRDTQWNIQGLEKIGINILPWPLDPVFTGSAWQPADPAFPAVAAMLMSAVLNSNERIRKALAAPVPVVTRGTQGRCSQSLYKH